MQTNTTAWNRIRYGAAAPVYDLLLAPLQALGFRRARRRAIQLLAPQPGSRLLIVGAGTGHDLEHIPQGIDVVATDLSPRMVRALAKRGDKLGAPVETHVMDGESLAFPDGTFDHVVLHLILAVMPDPQACAREVARVLKPGGTVSIFDKFVPDGASPSLARRVVNVLATVVFSDLTRQLGPILEAGDLRSVVSESAVWGLFTIAVAEG